MIHRARLPRRAALLLLLAGLAACQTPPPASPGGALHVGRLGLQVAGDAQRSFTAGFELRGTPQRGQLTLEGPLGSTAGLARWDPDRAELLTRDGSRDFADLDTLTEELLGEPVPVRALFAWLTGRPSSDLPFSAEPGGLAVGFEQAGWRVSLARWGEGQLAAVREQPLPRITLRVRLDRP